jgi:hypothetical protein
VVSRQLPERLPPPAASLWLPWLLAQATRGVGDLTVGVGVAAVVAAVRQKAGLVRRAASPTDRRAVIIEATGASLALRATVEDAWTELERLTVGTLSERQQVEVRKQLGLLEAKLAAVES